MKKLLILLSICALTLAACKGNALEIAPTNNADYNVDLLFEVDSCKVYRFMDGGKYLYFVTRPGEVMWNTEEGSKAKHTVHHSIPTE